MVALYESRKGLPPTDPTDAEYNLPRDEYVLCLSAIFHSRSSSDKSDDSMTEHSRLDTQADGFLSLVHNRLVHAPLQTPLKVLDIGCGTGATTRQLAALYPSASVHGVDISPVPAFDPSPPSVIYIIGDIKNLARTDGRLASGGFEYIFQRLLIGGMTDWAMHISEMVALLKPGGWLEVHDYVQVWYKNGEICSGDWRWHKVMREGASRSGMDLECGLKAREYMARAGLVEVDVVRYVVPYGTWMAEEKPETKAIGE